MLLPFYLFTGPKALPRAGSENLFIFDWTISRPNA
jgi:hypothetical protein